MDLKVKRYCDIPYQRCENLTPVYNRWTKKVD